jgi:hypothetical protein
MRRATLVLMMGALLCVPAAVDGQERTPPPTSCKDAPRGPLVCPYEWGGPGLDRGGRAQRFRACCAGAEVQLHVDTVETVRNVRSMTLAAPGGRSLSSERCHKVARHKSAPWACSWSYDQLGSLSGAGRLRVSDRTGAPVLDDAVDLDRLASLTR